MFPQEFNFKENHPFKYGYGTLFHSGYHYVDLLTNLLNLNRKFSLKLFQNLKIKVVKRLISNSWNKKHLQKRKDKNCDFGEIDLGILGQIGYANKVSTTFNVSLVGNSLSKRTSLLDLSFNIPVSGRLRQEHVIIHLGYVASIYVSNFPFNNKIINTSSNLIEDFNIHVFRRRNISREDIILQNINREKLSTIYQDLPLDVSMNKFSRILQLKKFLYLQKTNSELFSHKNSIRLFGNIQKKLLYE